MTWKHFLHYWPLWGESTSASVIGVSLHTKCQWCRQVDSHHKGPVIQRLVDSLIKGQWCRVLVFSLLAAWESFWTNNRVAGDFACHGCNDCGRMSNMKCKWNLLVNGTLDTESVAKKGTWPWYTIRRWLMDIERNRKHGEAEMRET